MYLTQIITELEKTDKTRRFTRSSWGDNSPMYFTGIDGTETQPNIQTVYTLHFDNKHGLGEIQLDYKDYEFIN
jgi:hypothetical protein